MICYVHAMNELRYLLIFSVLGLRSLHVSIYKDVYKHKFLFKHSSSEFKVVEAPLS